MRSHQLRSVPTDTSPPQPTFVNDNKMLHRKIENLSSIVSSLNAAIEDLESFDMPPLEDGFDFYQEVERFEVSLIKSALRMSGGSQVKAARLLKLNATTLSAKIKTLNLHGK